MWVPMGCVSSRCLFNLCVLWFLPASKMGETQFLCQGNGACVLIVSDSATPPTAVCQVPLCMGFSGREHCSGTFTFHFHALEEEMATHSSVLAWRIPATAGPGGLPSMGSHTLPCRRKMRATLLSHAPAPRGQPRLPPAARPPLTPFLGKKKKNTSKCLHLRV